MTRIGILGGTRFIGIHLINAALAKNWEVSIFNRGVSKPPVKIPENVEWVKGDRNRPQDLENFFKKDYDFVFDLSAGKLSHVRPIAENYSPKIGHYVFCSTSVVYQQPMPLPCDENAVRTKKSGTYGGEKALCEEMLLDYWGKRNWPVTIFRPQAIFGEYDAGAQLQYVFSRLKNGVPILLGKRADPRTNMLFVNDLTSAFLKSVENSNSHGQVYNIAGNEELNQTTLVELCWKTSGLRIAMAKFNEPLYRGFDLGNPWPQSSAVLSNSKIKSELNLEFTPLKEAIGLTWKWLEQNPEQLKVELGRGETYALNGKPIPQMKQLRWKFDDAVEKIKRSFMPFMVEARAAKRAIE